MMGALTAAWARGESFEQVLETGCRGGRRQLPAPRPGWRLARGSRSSWPGRWCSSRGPRAAGAAEASVPPVAQARQERGPPRTLLTTAGRRARRAALPTGRLRRSTRHARRGRVAASRARPALSRTGRPASEEWASEPSRCTSPSRARPRTKSPPVPSAMKSAVHWIRHPARDELAAGAPRRSAPAWRSGWATIARTPRAARRSTSVVQFDAERTGRRLEQHPAVAREREPAQLLGGQTLGGALRDLAPHQDPHADPPPQELALQQGHAAGQLGDADVVIIADVRRGAHDRDPVLVGLTGHRHAVLEARVPRRRAPAGCGSGHRPARGRSDSPWRSSRSGG